MIKNRYADFTQNRTRVFLTFFLGLVLYNFIIVNNFSFFKTGIIDYTYHIVDFSLGFCTKLLPGAVFTFLFKDVLPWHVTLVETVLLLIVFAVVSFYIAKLICSQENEENRKAMIIFSLFLITGPVTFSTFTLELGMLDIYWIYFSLIFFLFISKKYLYFFIPVIYVLSVSIHFSSLVSYILLFSIIILYRISKEKNGRFILIFILFVSIIISLFLTVIFMKNESENLTYDLNGFHNFIDSRNRMEGDPYYIYYDYSFYKVPYVENYPFDSMEKDLLIHNGGFVPDFLVNIINAFWQQVHIVLCSYKEMPRYIFKLFHLILITFPLAVFFIRFWVCNIRETWKNDRFISFTYFLMLVQFPVTAVVGCLCSPDFTRWFTHAFLIQFTLVLCVIFTENESPVKWIKDYFSKYDKKLLFLYWFVYSITLFLIYD